MYFYLKQNSIIKYFKINRTRIHNNNVDYDKDILFFIVFYKIFKNNFKFVSFILSLKIYDYLTVINFWNLSFFVLYLFTLIKKSLIICNLIITLIKNTFSKFSVSIKKKTRILAKFLSRFFQRPYWWCYSLH